MSMIHAILSILVGALGGLSARVIFSFAASVALLPLSLFFKKGNSSVYSTSRFGFVLNWLLLFPCMILQ